jgi:hypothetical protein
MEWSQERARLVGVFLAACVELLEGFWIMSVFMRTVSRRSWELGVRVPGKYLLMCGADLIPAGRQVTNCEMPHYPATHSTDRGVLVPSRW